MAARNPKGFFGWLLFGGSSKLRSYEERCILELFSRLGAEAGEAERHLSSLRRVQRFNSDRQVNLYFDEAGPHFANRADELSLGRLAYGANGGRIEVEVVAHRGQLSSLEFSRTPSANVLGSADLLDVKVFSNPNTQEAPTPGADELVPVALRRLLGDVPFSDVKAPPAETELSAFRERLGGEVPADLMQLLSISDGWKSGRWRFFGTRARRLPRRGDSLIAVAEDEQRVIAPNRSGGGRWILFDGVTEEESASSEDLHDILRGLLREA